jgi:uncharacterized protein (TIGR00730 family)
MAQNLGKEIASRGLILVYGGGNVGTMGALAESAMNAGGRVVGIIPTKLYEMVSHLDLTELLVVKDMHERKALMQEKADAFITLPGGIGTLEEMFEVWAWRYIGYHAKPLGILDAGGFYKGLLDFLAHVVDEGFLRKDILEDLLVTDTPAKMLDLLLDADRKGEKPVLKVPERR